MSDQEQKPNDQEQRPQLAIVRSEAAEPTNENTAPPSCLFCHTPVMRNPAGSVYEIDGVAWRTRPPRGSTFQPEELGYTHLGSCTYGMAKATEYTGQTVTRLGNSMLVSYEE